MPPTPLPFRQVHLDFHTSPHIPDVGLDFDPQVFVATLQAAHVNSVTVFARCHHGYCYYPTTVGTPHPHLQRPDLLGEMIAACHQAGIRAPIYTTVMWDELAWAEHPEWRQVGPDGGINGPSSTPLQPGWKNLCVNTGYADTVIAHIEELFDRYEVDEVFVDILLEPPRARCVCAACLAEMVREGIDPADPAQLDRFALATHRRFMARTSAAIRARDPGAGIYYNSRLRVQWDPAGGSPPELGDYTHLEIESLPGGFWGYDHFPLFARYFQGLGMDMLAMTGRFHTWWGDFGGLRNRAALAFECFQALAHGAGCSIGDQLHPRGQLNPAVYQRIGEVYAEVERREPWCLDTEPLPDIGVLVTGATGEDEKQFFSAADLGALHVLEQEKHQFQFFDKEADLAPYHLVILPDGAPVDEGLAARLRTYLAGGGALLIGDRAGLDGEAGDFRLADVMGVHHDGPAAFAPDYLALTEAVAANVEPMHHVCEQPGSRLRLEDGVAVLARSGQPYFNRTWQHFCSHQYTPLDAVGEEPVIVQQGRVITLARPLFREYAESARRVHKQVLANCIRRLLMTPRVGAHTLPSTAIVTARRQGQDLIAHLLHYVHQRRGRTLDVIEDVIPLHDVQISIRAERQPGAVRLVPGEEPLAFTWADGYARFIVPRVEGHQMVQLVDALEP